MSDFPPPSSLSGCWRNTTAVNGRDEGPPPSSSSSLFSSSRSTQHQHHHHHNGNGRNKEIGHGHGSGGHTHHHGGGSRGGAHDTIVNMISMLTLGVDEEQYHSAAAPPPPVPAARKNSGQNLSRPPPPPSSTSAVDNQRMVLLSMANTPESCLTLRRAGCIPLLVELIHPPSHSSSSEDRPPEIIQIRAARALKNIVQFNSDEKEKKKELRVLRLLEGIRLFTEAVKSGVKKKKSRPSESDGGGSSKEDEDQDDDNIPHPTTSLGTLTKLSFDEEHRCTMCLLGAVHVLADLIVSDHVIHKSITHLKDDCLLLRRLSGMALTNLTVNDKTNKALLCGMKDFLKCLCQQLECDNEEICQITASVFRNLSCRIDSSSKASLSEITACPKLLLVAMRAQRESTLKASLGALWNLSAQTPKNMVDISTASDEGLPFLVSLMRPSSDLMQQFQTPMTIIEHASGILRNISPHLRNFPELKKVLRDQHCYEILLDHLKSSSMIVVANACGTLCSLSGGPECEEDQRKLLDLNAIPMLKSLVYSKDQRISQGSSTALRNLLSSKFAKEYTYHVDSRLSAQIYTQPSQQDLERGGGSASFPQRSPNSDSDPDQDSALDSIRSAPSTTEYAQRCSTHVNVQPMDPPLAHQQTPTVYPRSYSGHFNNKPPISIQFHNHPPLSLPLHGGGPSSSYHNHFSSDVEPLDLTMTSTKSSPIHIISAAEFAGLGGGERRNFGVRGAGANTTSSVVSTGGRSYSQSHSYQSFEAYHSSDRHQNPMFHQAHSRQYNFLTSTSFNQSCPEIRSRLPNAHSSSRQNYHHENAYKPVDYSTGGEQIQMPNNNLIHDSSGGCGGDTTFNYSLQYAEHDGEEESGHNTTAKSEDTVKTYCYEGTPQFSKSNSCQDLLQEVEEDKASGGESASAFVVKSCSANKLQPIDEVRPYYVENTPAAFSRASSLSSIHSTEEEMTGGEGEGHPRPEDKFQPAEQQLQLQPPPLPAPRKRNSQSHTPSSCRVTFSAEETPLMFSRASSVASLDSLQQEMAMAGGASRNDDELSDYSRRASGVVSPSELPDSPRALAPPPMPPLTFKRVDAVDGSPSKYNMDSVRVFTIEEKSGFNSCRSLSPLTVDGEELGVIGKTFTSPNEERSTQQRKSNTDIVDGNETSTPLSTKCHDDELKVFATEGTPFYGISTATSLSDIIGELDDAKVPLQSIAESKVTTTTSDQPTETPMPVGAKDTIESDTLLLEKCIKVGKAMGIPKSQSEFRLGNKKQGILKGSGGQSGKHQKVAASKSQDFEFDDPDLAALIQIGRNTRTKEKDRTTGHKHHSNKGGKRDKNSSASVHTNSSSTATDQAQPSPSKESETSSTIITQNIEQEEHNNNSSQVVETSSENGPPPPINDDSCNNNNKGPSEEANLVGEGEYESDLHTRMKLSLEPNQMSTTSLGSEWNDETPTFSSPIPSMSVSVALKMVESLSMDTSLPHVVTTGPMMTSQNPVNNLNDSLNISCLSVSVQRELLENVDPPSTSYNLVSSTDCVAMQARRGSGQSSSALSDKINEKWKALADGANNCSTQSNLAGQRPPLDILDMENSMMSVASIKSEIYEMSITENSDIFKSAVDEDGPPILRDGRGGGGGDNDNSLGGNTYTIFPPENVNRLSGVKSNDFSEGNTVISISEDFTDAEDIEDYETAPILSSDEQQPNSAVAEEKKSPEDVEPPLPPKPRLEVRPMVDNNAKKMDGINSNRFNTFLVKKNSSPSSPRSSPRAKRREDPERYKTHTINPIINNTKPPPMPHHDANGNPAEPNRYATFKVGNGGGSKIIGPHQRSNSNIAETSDSTSTVSPTSSPGGSPKGIRGRRKPLYSSLPPSAIVRKGQGQSRHTHTPPPPIPPKPARMGSPVRTSSFTSVTSTSAAPFVRPTRTTELRAAAAKNGSRDSSPKRVENNSRTNSNSSLHLVTTTTTSSKASVSSDAGTRPKVAPKPPVRTTPVTSASTIPSSAPFDILIGRYRNIAKPPKGSSHIKGSNSSYGFGARDALSETESDSGLMKLYSTLPKSTKLGSSSLAPFSLERYSAKGESKESIPGSEKSGKSGIAKITNLWKKIDFRGKNTNTNEALKKEPQVASVKPTSSSTSKGSKLSNLFSRGKKDKNKDKEKPPPNPSQKPFRDALPVHSNSAPVNFALPSAPASTSRIPGMRQDGEQHNNRGPFPPHVQVHTNKVLVPPFNYTPPDRSASSLSTAPSQASCSSFVTSAKITTV